MIVALLLAAIAPVQSAPPAKAAPPPAADTAEDIVVTARVGRAVLLFDKGADGRLHNCRVMKSSGYAEDDAEACSDLPDCITDRTGHRYCGDAMATAAIDAPTNRPVPGIGLPLTLPKLVQPEPDAPPPDVGPVSGSRKSTWQPPKLPPLPKEDKGDSGFKITGKLSDGDSSNHY